MRKIKLIEDKKAISIMVAYVLLIIIAISIAILVYAWMKNYLPFQAEKCPDAVSISLVNYTCNNKKINLTLKNNGLFNLGGFIAIAEGSVGFGASGTGACNLKKGKDIENLFITKDLVLKPSEIYYTEEFDYSECGNIKKVNIEPFVYGEEERIPILCDNSIVKYNIEGCD